MSHFFLVASSFPDWSWEEYLGGEHTAGWFWFGAEGTEWMVGLSIIFQEKAGGRTGLTQLPAGFPTEAGFLQELTPLTKVKCLPSG